jgi:hypothetical protein
VVLGSGQTVVTYTNVPAAPGELKVCANQDPTKSTQTVGSFTYTVADASATPSTETVIVPVGSCVFAGGDASPTQFPFNSTASITETAVPNNGASGIVVTPGTVNEIVGSTPTSLTDQPDFNSMVAGGTGAVSSVNAIIGENDVTIATFAVFDPPADSPVVSTPGSGVVTGTGVTIATPTVSTGSSVASTFTSSIGSSSTVSGSTSIGITATTVKTLTSAQRKAELAKDQKSLTNVKASITKWTKTLSHTKGAAHKAAQRKLTSLKAQLKVLNLEIKLLK